MYKEACSTPFPSRACLVAVGMSPNNELTIKHFSKTEFIVLDIKPVMIVTN